MDCLSRLVFMLEASGGLGADHRDIDRSHVTFISNNRFVLLRYGVAHLIEHGTNNALVWV